MTDPGFMYGILPLNKPPGISSAGALNRIKRMLPRGVKIGHAGTLDPFATGLLIVLLGKATRLAEKFMSDRKHYTTTVKLGATTSTLDPESPEIPAPFIAVPSEATIRSALERFLGSIEQVPPAFSALKISGRPAYKLARSGQEISLKPRRVQVHSLELLSYEWPALTMRVECGRGTYIRSLARDIGAALGTGGYVTALQRTRVGAFCIEDSVALDSLVADGIEAHLRAP